MQQQEQQLTTAPAGTAYLNLIQYLFDFTINESGFRNLSYLN